MSFRMTCACLAFVSGLCGTLSAQSLDGTPYTPGVDAEIDMYMNTWKNSMPQVTHGSLVERAVLTPGDPVKPPAKGAVLSFVNRFSLATLAPGASTVPVTLEGEQEVFFVIGGKGAVSTTGKRADLYPGIGVLMPPGVEFTLRNTGGGQLRMYLVAEPVPADFRPNEDMLVVDENTVPISTSNTHWVGIAKPLFSTQDGLGTLESVITCTFDAMTFFHPHSHVPGCEEVWCTIDDGLYVLLGKQIRFQPPGTAYMIPPDGKTPHANFNVADEPVKMFYFARYRDHEPRK